MFRSNRRRIVLKSREEIELMRRAGQIVARALDEVRRHTRPGVSTAELDRIAEDVLRRHNAAPVFKGYPNPHPGGPPFPATITACINEELVHGIPSPHRVLQEGDIFSVDCGAYYKGWVGDAAITVPVGEISAEARRLLEVTEQALYEGIAQGRVGNRTEDISAAVQAYVEAHGYSVVREYTGHGVGRNMHEDPQVPNFGQAGKGVPLKAGMTIALEPMVQVGTWKTRVLDDGWTVVSADGSLSAHFEHSFAVTDGEPDILTLL
ncbi:MAG: type I methionyl aminopeptidase [Chloroflexi bacterium]|nr:MAG: type I methionyl aminopeptidase [Chloroflexota bacterium]